MLIRLALQKSPIVWLLMLAALPISPLLAADIPPVRIEQRLEISDLPQATGDRALSLSIADIGNWPQQAIVAAVREAAQTLAQCNIRIVRAELLRIAVPESHRHFDTPRSRELARALKPDRPMLYFAAGTRQVPAFDAEAIGRGNSRSRPELADSVWIARGARDLGIVVAHELAHVLMDSGAHDNTPGNLMSESTTQGSTQLTAEQCTKIRDTGTRNGLLRPGVN